MDPFATLSGFKYFLTSHSIGSGWVVFRMDQNPGTGITLCVKCQVAIGIVVLLQSFLKICRLPDIDFP